MRAGSRWLGRSAIAASLLTALLAACSGGGGPTAPNATGAASGGGPGSIAWRSCNGADGPKGYQCASLLVPRDPRHPGAGTIAMALDRHPASGQRVGSLVLNPGGPGVSGVDFLPDAVKLLSKKLVSSFDLVSFDPPGVDRTAPVVCLDPAGLSAYFHTDPAPPTAAGFAALVASEQVLAQGCEKRSGAELPYVSTADAVADLDLLRQALGDGALSYMGFSYGTLIGAGYAHRFPSRVRALVLDGAIDPAVPVITRLDEQSASLDSQLQRFFAFCAAWSGCPWQQGRDPEATFLALLQRVRSSPLPVAGSARTVGPSELLFGTGQALYSPGYWKFLSEALAQAERGDGTAVMELFDAYTERNADGTYSNVFEANAAVNCLDAPAPSMSELRADAAHSAAVAPVFGVTNLYGEITCDVWPLPATSEVGPLAAPGSAPIVVVGSTGDPVTPYRWAKGLAAELGPAVLITREGDGHTGYRFSSCVRRAVDAYLIDLAVPAPGLSCPTG